MEEIDEREGRVVRTIPVDTFGNRLILVRAHLGHLTVKEAAEKCTLNYGSWSNWERGKLPRDKIEVADAISEALGIDRDWLLHGGPLEPPAKTRRGIRVAYRRLNGLRPGTVRRPQRIDRRERIPA